jgi:hypothetical protein
MAMFDTELDGSPVVQSVYEDTRWRVDLWPGCAPSSPTVQVLEITALDTYTDVTSTRAHGTAQVDGDVFYTPYVYQLEAGKEYRVNCRFTTNSNVRERWFRIRGRA